MATENADNINSENTSGSEEVQVQLIDGVCVVTTNDVSSTLASPIVIEKPAAGQTTTFDAVGGQKYVFDFSENNVDSFIQEGGDLTLSFADGSSIQLIGFGTASSSAIPTTLAFTGEMTPSELQSLIRVVDAQPAIEELEVIEEEPQADVRGEEQADSGEGETGGDDVAQIEPAAGQEDEITPEELAQVQEELAQIEPAAGDAGGAGASADAGGAGFQSSFTPQGVIPIEDIGPIGPTALQYQIPEFREDIFAQEQDDQPDILSPAALNLDETNLDGGPIVLGGNVNVSFGNDGPGTISPDGSFSSGGSQTGGTLSSNGNLIDVTPTADGYVGTINGGADTVFEITINPNTGAFEFTQFLPIDHADGTDANDVVTLNFGVVATDADGDAANTSITVNIADDAPAIAAPDENTVDETTLSGGPIVVNDTLVVDFGQDGPGDVTPSGTTNVTGVGTLASNGQPITITQTATGYEGTLPGGAPAFTLTIDPATGGYIYTQFVPVDHDVVTDTISIDFGVNVTDFDTDSTATTITINIVDSVPEIKDDNPEIGKGIENVDETNLPGGSTASGSLDVDFGTDLPAQIVPDGNTTVTGSVAGGSLTSNGADVIITQTADGYVGTINGGADTVFTFTIDPTNGDYVFNQLLAIDHADGTDANDIITITFGVVAEDSDGDSDSGSVTINIADDGPQVSDSTATTINENTVDTAPITVNGSVNPDFGADGPGDVQPNGTTSVNGVTTLTSNGEAITVTQTANGYVGTLAGGDTAFELTLNPATGEYEFTQFVALDHEAGNDIITLNFGVTGTDYDTDTDTATISINIKDSVPEINDNPKLGDGLEVVDETDLPGVTASGQLTVDFGSDLPGAVTADGSFTSGGSQLNGALSSNGEPVTVTLVGDTYTGTANGQTIFTLQIDTDGSYNFTLLGTLDHADPNDPNDIIDLEFGVVATDGDGDTDSTTILIKVKDDVPVIGDAAGDVDESNFDNGPLSTSDTLFTDFGTEVGTIAPDGNAIAEANGNPIALTSNGDAVTITQTADGYVGTTNGGGTTVFTITVDAATGQYVYTQFETLDHPDGTDPNDTIELSFGVAVTSVDGDSDTGTITISVGDDGPVANDEFSGAEEGQLVTGNLLTNDELSEDADNTVTNVEFDGTDYPITAGGFVTITTTLGEITINSDGTYTYIATDLGDPDGTDVFTYTLTDGDGDSDTAELSVRVTPDGEPVAVTEEMTVDETNLTPGPLVINESIALDFGLDGAGTFDPNGDFQFGGSAANNALTSNGVPVVVTQTTDGYVGTIQGTTDVVFELTVQDNGDYTFELFNTLDHADATDPNDTIVLDFGVTLTDIDGDKADGTITINVLDDAPVAFDDANTVPENQLTANGNVTDNDINGEDAPSTVTSISFNGTQVPVVVGTATTINGQYGTLEINADGTYTYTSFGTNTTAVQDVFTYSLTDFDGDTDTAELKINITDIDVQPEVIGSEVTVDETDLDPTDDASNTVTANFGVDGPGTITVSGANTFTFDGAENNALTSNGTPVTVTTQGNTYVGTAGTETIFTLVLDQNTGDYTFTLFGTLDHADETNPDDIIELTFGVTATDSDGDTETGTITVNVKDDGPFINGKAKPIDEDGLKNGPISYTHTLVHDYGEDGQGEIRPTDVFMTQYQVGGPNQTLTSGGEEVFVTATANGYIGQTAGGETIFTLTINNDGQYTYTQFKAIDHPDANNADDVIWLKFQVEIVDYDGDTDTAFITVDLHDSGPIINEAQVQPLIVDETDMNPTDTDANVISAEFHGDVPGTFTVTGAGTFTHAGGTNGQLTSNDVPVDVNVVGNDYVGTANGVEVFRLTLNEATGEYEFILSGPLDHADTTNPDDIIELSFGVTATDSDGDTDTGSIVVQVKDDGPQANDDLNTYDTTNGGTDGNVITGRNGGAGAADDLSKDDAAPESADHDVVEVSFGTTTVAVPAGGSAIIEGDFGTLTIFDNGEYTYTLKPGVTPPGGTTTSELNPSATDVSGTQESFTKDGITVSVANNGDFDITWLDTADGSGLGINNLNTNDSTKVWPQGETFNIALAQAATQVELTIAEIGNNNDDGNHGVDYTITFSDGTTAVGEQQFAPGEIVDGTITFTIDSADYAGKTITSIDLNSTNAGQYQGASFLLNNVVATHEGNAMLMDQFEYVLQDGDGDQDTAILKFNGKDLTDDQPELTTSDVTVDETNLNPTDDASNTVTADFGADVPGPITVTGANTFDFNGAENNQLTSNGVPVVVATQGTDTYVGTAGTETIFTLVVQPNGQYTFTLFGTLDHADETNPDDVIQLMFDVTATDGDGDTDTGTITVNVKDDGPYINTKAAAIDEDGLVNGPISYTRTLNHDYGEDGQGEINPDGTFMAVYQMGGQNQTLTSDGEEVIVTQTADGYIGQTAGGDTIFTVVVQNNGQYTYTQFAGLDHPDPNNGDDVIWLKFGVEIVDYDGDTDTAFIQVDVHDAMPTAPNNSVFPVAEHGLENGPVIVMRNFNGGDFGGDGEGQYEFDGTFMLRGNSSTLNNDLTSGGEAIDVTFNGNVATGKLADGTVVFTMELDPATGKHTFTLFESLDHGKPDASGAQDVVWAKFGVNIVDADGDSKPGMIQVDIRDDAPDAINDTDTVADNETSTSGNVIPNDDLSADEPNTVTEISFGGTTKTVVAGTPTEIDGQFGKLSINADGTYTYTTFGTNTTPVQEVFTYTLTDYDGDSDDATLTIDVARVDDQPELTTSEVTVDETDLDPTDDASNTVTADFGSDAPGTYTVTGAGSFNFNGAENNQLTSGGVPVTVSVQGNSYVGTAGTETVFTLELNQTTGQYTFTLIGTLDHADETNPDDVIQLFFDVDATDSDGDTDTGTITVNVKDDGPYIQSKASAIDEDGLVNGPISYTRTLNHDYGEDGAGEIRPTDTFMATFSMGGSAQTITSDGVPVAIETTANGYVGKANGQTIFTLEVQTNGQYTYTQYAGLDHPDTNNDDDVMWLKFGVEIVDFDGDTAPATITVDVHDSAPTAPNNSVFPVAEHGLENGPVVVMRNFNGGDFGGDGEGQYEYNGTFMLLGNSSTATDELTSGGEKVEVTFNGNVATGTTVGGTVVFTMELDPTTGKHTFTLFESLDHGKTDASGSSDVVWAKFGVDIVDADGDRDSAMIQVDIRDDAPEAGANSVFPVSEAGLINGPVEVTRDLDGDFHADGEGQYEYNGTFMLLGNSSTATDELTSGGEKVEVTFNGNVATGTTVGGTVVFTMELDPSTGEHTFTLFEALDHGKPDASGAQDVVWAKFGVDIVDADGDRDSTMIQVDIRDHAPIAKDDCNEFEVEVVNKDFNVVMALDVSGSMSGDKIALLKSSVNNLLTDFNGYNGGEIKVHLVPFATYAGAGETFTITDTADLNAALAYIDGLWADGTTNYEPPLQSAINWLNGATDNDPIAGADTYTYFVSDGSPNRYLDANGQLAAGNADQVMGEITGSDGSDEVGILQGLSTEVIGVGIGVDGATLARLGQIDSDGTALDVQDPTDLEAMLQATSPIKGSTSGNVITGEHGGPGAADMLSADADNTVTQIRFGTQTINLPTDGSNVAINGDYGTLTINSTGEYGYELFDAAYSTETSYVFTKFNPPGSDNGGDIKKVQTSYNETTESLSFEMVIDPVSEGFTLALNNGPNPKGHGGELALIYFDASGTEPVITVYAYNGANTQTSYKDGSAAAGTQTPDKILSSITDPDAFDITVTTDANGNKVFSFDMDASTIQAHDPIHGPNGDWSGVSFDESVGIWLHPVKNLDTEYNSDGFLSNWTGSNGYYDTSNQKTVEHITTDGSTSDQFEYVLTDGDGDSDVATLTLKSTAAESSVFTGSDSADVIEGTDEGDVIAGGLGNDTLYGGEGADTFLFNALNEGVDTIKDFDAAEGDNFDVGALIQGYDALQDSIDDFVFTTEQGGDTVVSVDPTGSGNAANATQIAILEAVTGLSADDIVGDDNSQTTV